jgi:hypothetical protein
MTLRDLLSLLKNPRNPSDPRPEQRACARRREQAGRSSLLYLEENPASFPSPGVNSRAPHGRCPGATRDVSQPQCAYASQASGATSTDETCPMARSAGNSGSPQVPGTSREDTLFPDREGEASYWFQRRRGVLLKPRAGEQRGSPEEVEWSRCPTPFDDRAGVR